MEFFSDYFANFVNGSHLGEVRTIRHFLYDSRHFNGNLDDGSAFIAIKTMSGDGHTYINDLYFRGVRIFIVNDKNLVSFNDATVILVSDVLSAIQFFAIHLRSKFEKNVIGITGSNGKTTVKEWLYVLLRTSLKVYRSPGSYNSQLGVPISMIHSNPHSDLQIFEAGISMKGEMEKLERIIQPDIVVFTGIGSAHNAGFKSTIDKIREKLILALGASKIVFPFDNSEIRSAIVESFEHTNKKLIGWGNHSDSQIKIKYIELDKHSSNLKLIYNNIEYLLRIPFTDTPSIHNCISCFSLLIALGLYNENVSQRFLLLEHLSGRMELMEGINRTLIINDSYTNDLNAFKNALNYTKQIASGSQVTIITSESPDISPNELAYEIQNFRQNINLKRIIFFGKQSFPNDFITENYFQTEDFLNKLNQSDFHDEVVLVKGGRDYKLEKIVDRLLNRKRRTRVEICLESIENNLRYFRSICPEGTGIIGMVKASGYGSGGVEMGRLLAYNRVDFLAVAYTDEGIEIRNAGIDTRIIVLNPEPETLHSLFEFNLEPVIFSSEQLKNILELAKIRNQSLEIHLEFETGMNRLGIVEDDLKKLIFFLKSTNLIHCSTAYTHLTSSDELNTDIYSKIQLEKLLNLVKKMEHELGYSIPMHISNTAGILKYGNMGLKYIRPGIGLYGISTLNNCDDELENAIRVYTYISQIKLVKKGETIGYNRLERVNNDMNIAIIAMGYADGLDRRMGLRNGVVYIKNTACPLVGKVCMDMAMIDIGDLNALPGDEVIIFENKEQLRKMADVCNTIPYEILTGLSSRLPRYYIR